MSALDFGLVLASGAVGWGLGLIILMLAQDYLDKRRRRLQEPHNEPGGKGATHV